MGALLLFLSLFLLPSIALAQPNPNAPLLGPMETYVPPDVNLGDALRDLARMRHLQIVYVSAQAHNLQTHGAAGILSATEALEQLLQGTGLEFKFLDAETVEILPQPSGSSLSASIPPPTPPAPARPRSSAPPRATKPPATASAASAAARELQEVTVSASAISILGYEAPTPVTAISLQQLQSEARTDVADVLRNLPPYSGSPSPENSDYAGLVSAGIQGEDLLNLRDLGVNRTLVLFDGQRVVQSNIQGGVDVSTLPSSLVERIDTVTGGASAVWGSDALAGVINLIINKSFNGVQLNLEGSNNSQGLHPQQKAELTLGTPFADGRGHIEAAGSYWNVPRPYFTHEVPGWASQRLVANPACSHYVFESAVCPPGEPVWIHASGVGLASATTGGLITGGLNGAPSPLSNVAFGAGGTPYLFNRGNVTEGFFSNGGTPNYDTGFIGLNAQPLRNETAFALASWKFNDALSASLQLNYGTTATENNSYSADQYGNVPIYSGNPFIPPSIQQYLAAHSLAGFTLGTTNQNNVPGGGGSLDSQINSLGIPVAYVRRSLARGVFTLEGSFAPHWTWNAYFMHGESHMYESMLNNVDRPNLLQAENVVLGPAGVPTCAATLNPALAVSGAYPGCQPLNVMGLGLASQAAIDYITGPTKNGQDAQSMTLTENVAAASLQGQLPFGLAAGPIAAAAGLVYRNERGVTTNCGINCDQVNFSLSNFAAFGPASYDIREASAEVNLPLLHQRFVRSASLDLAARISDYSTSGTVATYKFGLVSQLTDVVRFRGSYSYDIRAPDLFELFSNPLPILTNGTDPRTGQAVAFFGTSVGNPHLRPELGETRTFGLVLTPLAGMNVSADWYYILIKDAINEGFSSSAIEAQCAAGSAAFCQDLIFSRYPGGCHGPTLDACPAGPLAAVLSPPLNFDRETNSGIDVNGDYRFPFLSGALDLNTSINYMFQQRYTSINGSCDSANSLGADASAVFCPILGVPKFKGSVALTYSQDGWLGTLQARMIGAAHLYTGWQNGVNVDNNDLPFYTYLDARLSYRFAAGVSVYAAVDNIADRIMPVIADTPNAITIFEPPYRDDTYDGFGRVWRVGVRLKW
jgi:outer membrane receptor protein involved in Fe transport